MRAARADRRAVSDATGLTPVAAATEPDGGLAVRVVPAPGLVRGPDAPELRRRAAEPGDPLGGSPVDAQVGGALARLQGAGRPLPDSVAGPMGEAMGADLGGVRIHTGPEPARLARSVQATAFTLGRDIFFGAGSYAPQTADGQRLLAHELAHTIAPAGGAGAGSGSGPIIGRAADPAEAQADRVADDALRVLRRRSAAPAEPAGVPAAESAPLSLLRHPAPNPGRDQLRRKVGIEAELMVPSLGPSANGLTYVKEPGKVTDSIKSFLDGGVAYGTDIGGKAGGADVRLDSDHGGSIDRTPIVNKLIDLGWVTGKPSEPRTKIEFVTTAMDEFAPGANRRIRTVGLELRSQLTAALTQAQSGELRQLGAPAKAGYKTGVPVADLKAWLGGDYAALDATIKEYLTSGVKDDVYLQATVGILPSSLLAFFARTALTGGKVEVAPPSAARQQILGIVAEVIAALDTTFAAAPEDHWISKLGATSKSAFMGILGLIYSYLLGDTLHQTSGGTLSTVKNAVPFLIKMSPYGLMGRTATSALVDDPPPRDFVRSIGAAFKRTKYLQLPYWVEESRKDQPTAVSDGKLPVKLDARPTATRLITGDYTDFVEQVLLDSGGDIRVVVGKELPAPDKPPTDAGGIDVFYELYNQQGIPLEYRAITKRYKISEVLPAVEEIISDVRLTNMGGLTEEQKATVTEAFK
ncbi:DUF4157 domain-containing protein [Nakamurella sp.]|uniref:DUF4157 domain-containing protein n=1 Tax=Nakamurella sp. TaxID=1869182 RepID=UPI003784FC5E